MENNTNKDLINIKATSRDINSINKLNDVFSSLLGRNLLKFTQSKLFLFPFNASLDILNKINEKSIECLMKINPLINQEHIHFKANVTFPDLMSISFDDYNAFISRAGDKDDPANVELEWSIFQIIDGTVFAGFIEIDFKTEKNFLTTDLPPGEFYRANIKLSVSGSSQEWVEHKFTEISPYIQVIKLGGIYKPLWFFRNKLFIQIVGLFISFSAFLVGYDFFLNLMVRNERNNTRSSVIEKILSESDTNLKIDALASAIFSPISSSPIWTSILALLGSILLYATLYFICLTLLPRLTPRSFIAIGLNSMKAKSYYNLFKFIIFDLMILSIVIPIIIIILT